MSTILSVGIDIGTSTTQLIFSEITMENTASYFSAPRISIVDKQIIYKSEVYNTPLIDLTTLDGDKIKDLVASEFDKAGYVPADVDTGAVIITGESARKENAAVVLEKLSEFAGEFVVSTAGPDLESIIAGKGSGAYQYSMDTNSMVVNLDIGGGTTNIVGFNDGETVGKVCYDIGGRLVRLTPDYVVQYISKSAKLVAEAVGVNIDVGSKTNDSELRRITDKMADLLAQALNLATKEPLLGKILTPHSSEFEITKPIRHIFFSGGVGEAVYNPTEDTVEFGDFGPLLGRSIKENKYFSTGLVEQAKETIRATVIGAGTYTTSISGSTIKYSPGVFPLKNIPALKLTPEEETEALGGNVSMLSEKIRWFAEQSDSKEILLAMRGPENPSYVEIKTLGRCIVESMQKALPAESPMVVVCESDIAKALGSAMASYIEDGRRMASIDNIKIEAGDYVDIGRPLMDGLVVPVIVKTLLFG